jgi:uncharacterized protein DUF3168
MSASDAFQKMIYDRLLAVPEITDKVGDRVYDGDFSSNIYPRITFGNSDTAPEPAACIDGTTETIQLDIWTEENGQKTEAKNLVDEVRKALDYFDGDMGEHALVSMRVVLTRISIDVDPLITHGFVQVTGQFENG